MTFLGIALHTNCFTCCYLDGKNGDKRTQTFQLVDHSLHSSTRPSTAGPMFSSRLPSIPSPSSSSFSTSLPRSLSPIPTSLRSSASPTRRPIRSMPKNSPVSSRCKHFQASDKSLLSSSLLNSSKTSGHSSPPTFSSVSRSRPRRTGFTRSSSKTYSPSPRSIYSGRRPGRSSGLYLLIQFSPSSLGCCSISSKALN